MTTLPAFSIHNPATLNGIIKVAATMGGFAALNQLEGFRRRLASPKNRHPFGFAAFRTGVMEGFHIRIGQVNDSKFYNKAKPTKPQTWFQ